MSKWNAKINPKITDEKKIDSDAGSISPRVGR
jgi:hypothetical protein